MKSLGAMCVFGQCVAIGDPRRVMAFDHHVGFADRKGLAIEFLPKQIDIQRRVHRLHGFLRHGKHAASPASRVIDAANDALSGQGFMVVGQQKID